MAETIYPEFKVLESAVREIAVSPAFQQAVNERAGFDVFVESKNGAKAIDVGALLKFLPAILQFLLPILLPGAGLSPALITALIQVIATIFGVSSQEAEKMLSDGLAQRSIGGPTE